MVSVLRLLQRHRRTGTGFPGRRGYRHGPKDVASRRFRQKPDFSTVEAYTADESSLRSCQRATTKLIARNSTIYRGTIPNSLSVPHCLVT